MKRTNIRFQMSESECKFLRQLVSNTAEIEDEELRELVDVQDLLERLDATLLKKQRNRR